MTQHSLLGASSAYRWLQCPGSFKLSQTAPHRPSSIYAATGSLAHELIEEAVADNKTEIGSHELGRTWSQDGHLITIDQDLIAGVNAMLDYYYNATMTSAWDKVEFRVSLDGYFAASPVPLFGTVDGAWHDYETLEIVDYKNGAGVMVSPVENPQLLYYAAGVLRDLDDDARQRLKRLRLTIVQPNAQHVTPIRSWELSIVDLLMWVNETLVPGVEACAQPDAPLNPGSWCRFCPVSHACPRLQQDAVAMAQREFDDTLDDTPADLGKDLAASLDIAERAQLWIERLREFAVDQLQRQVRIPGWGLVPTRPTRKWIDPDSKTASELSQTGLSHDQIWETRLRSPAQVEKACGRFIWDQVAPLVEAKSSGVKLARTGTSAREDFADDE